MSEYSDKLMDEAKMGYQQDIDSLTADLKECRGQLAARDAEVDYYINTFRNLSLGQLQEPDFEKYVQDQCHRALTYKRQALNGGD